MRVVSFNIHHGTVGRRGPVDPEQLGAVCAGFDADVIALQEVDRGTWRAGGADLAAVAAEACGMDHVFGPSRYFPGGRYGNALLVRGTIERSRVTQLPKVPAWRVWQERRTVLDAAVRIDGEELWVACTHLAVPEPVNEVQLDFVLQRARSRSLRQVVVGDLNREAAQVGPQAAAVGLEMADHGPTFPARKPRQTIDHVLHAPELVVVSTAVERTPMSDHAALIVDFA